MFTKKMQFYKFSVSENVTRGMALSASMNNVMNNTFKTLMEIFVPHSHLTSKISHNTTRIPGCKVTQFQGLFGFRVVKKNLQGCRISPPKLV